MATNSSKPSCTQGKVTDLCGVESPDRLSTGRAKDGTMDYLLDGKTVAFEDGFRMSVGQMKVPACFEDFSSFSHIPAETWNRIFPRGEN